MGESSASQSDDRFRQLAENAREVFWLLEVPSGRISYVNPAYEAIFGRTRQALYDDPEDWYHGIHPGDRARVIAAYEAAASHPYDEEYRIVRPDGAISWIRDRSVPVCDAEGKIIRVAGIAEEITARKRSEESLKSLNRALLTLGRCNEALVRAASEQALYDEVCRVIVEEGGYRMCWVGLVEQDQRRTIRPVAHAGIDDGYVEALDLVWSDTERGRGPTGTAARTGRPVHGRDFLTDPTLAPWRDQALKRGFRSLAALPMMVEGACLGVLTMHSGEPEAFSEEELRFLERLAEDLAFGVAAHRARVERDRLTAHLARTDRLVAMGTLAAGVAHEVNNPLTYVVSALDYVDELLDAARSGLTAEAALRARGVLAEAREGTERVRLIVRDLRSLSRGEDTLIELVELHPVLDFAIGMSRNELKHRARLTRDYGPVPPVRANAAKLGQVFLNLLINAAQAVPPGRVELNEIRVSTGTDPDGRARIEIRDSGIGVPPEVAGRLFEPFVTTKRMGEGTGLGLSICKAAIMAMGGEIGFEPAPDRGTIFRVTLPAAVAAEGDPPVEPVVAGGATSRRGRVAVVDDEAGVCRAIERLLDDEHEVDVFGNARELAERIAEGAHYDTILCDLMMPDMTGMELFGVLQRASPPLAEGMIFMTGGTFTQEAQAFLSAVPNPRLEKPFETATLRAVVRAQVELASPG